MARILLVDDSLFLKRMVKDIVTSFGHSVVGCASDGKEAIQQYAKLKPDLVFMDITMEKMSGIEAVRNIVDIDQDARIIMCSAMGQQSMILEALQAGARDFVVKPFQKERLRESIDRYAKNGPVM